MSKDKKPTPRPRAAPAAPITPTRSTARLTEEQVPELLAACQRVKAAPDFESAWTEFEPLLDVLHSKPPPDISRRIGDAFGSMVFTKPRRDAPQRKHQQALAEAAPTDPDKFLQGYVTHVDAEDAQRTRDVLQRFKDGAMGYICWVAQEDYAPEDLDAIEHAATFEEVRKVLARFDDPACSFLSMVREGYFVS